MIGFVITMAEFMPVRNRKIYKVRRESREEDFRSLYRFGRENVEWMTDHFLGEDSGESRGGALTNKQKMMIYLRFVGDPGFQSGIGEDLGVHRTTATKTISQVTSAILRKSDTWIKFPSNEAELNVAMEKWQRKYEFPSAIGAIDCTHISIIKPYEFGDEYINRKRIASINVQGTCNAAEEFTSVDAGWPGSVHDARIWRNSDVYSIMSGNRANALLLGDSGYGIAPWLMTPYEAPQTPRESSFNRLLTKERVIIERCFGQLKQRFPVIKYKIRVKLHKVPSVILSCCVLHNVAKYLGDPEFDFEEEEEQQRQEERQVVALSDVAIRNRGQQRRNAIAGIIHGQEN